MLNALLSEIHRLRLFIRDATAEVERAPKVHKAHQTKIANLQKAATDAKDDLKKRKAHQLELESRLKAANQTLAKHEKQFNELTTQKEFSAKQADIDSTKLLIVSIEEEILVSMSEIEGLTAKIPALEAAVVKGQEDFATFEVESAERITRLKGDIATSTKKLVGLDAKIPAPSKAIYDRLIKSHGADGLAKVETTSCTHCRITLTQQQTSELQKDVFCCCNNCGRALYR